jgi:hypothetical protein
VPEQRPALQGFRQRYRQGDIVRGNCTSRHSKPAANLTWTINEVVVSITDFLCFLLVLMH